MAEKKDIYIFIYIYMYMCAYITYILYIYSFSSFSGTKFDSSEYDFHFKRFMAVAVKFDVSTRQ